jgi:hypothetical protein
MRIELEIGVRNINDAKTSLSDSLAELVRPDDRTGSFQNWLIGSHDGSRGTQKAALWVVSSQ